MGKIETPDEIEDEKAKKVLERYAKRSKKSSNGSKSEKNEQESSFGELILFSVLLGVLWLASQLGGF